jgi:two-component system sensor histidine kinase/response regulator
MTQRTILVADDERQFMELSMEALRNLNEDFEIIGAPNGKVAYELATKKQPDLILLDWQMPEMSGVEALGKLKENETTKDIPVIMITGLSEPRNIEHALGKGAHDYLTKPFDKLELQARVKSALREYDYLQQIKTQQDELKQLNNLKDRIFSIISHDLRTPMAAVTMFVDMLTKNVEMFDAEMIRDIGGDLQESVQNASFLLDNLLKWAQSQMENLNIFVQEINIAEALRADIRLLQNGMKSKNINFIVEIPEGLSAQADSDSMSFIIRNLLSNSLKFTPNEGEIKLFARQNTDGKIRISVQDTGVGMSQEDLDKLFGTSTHFTTHGTDGEIGTGLGLLLCKEFAEKNEGNLSVKSELGKGTIFTLELKQ